MFTTLWQHRGFQRFWNTHDSFVQFFWGARGASQARSKLRHRWRKLSWSRFTWASQRTKKKSPKKNWQEIIENWILSTDSFHFCFWFFDFSGLQTFSLPMCQQLTQTDHRHRTSWLTADIAQIFKGLAPATKQRVAWSNEQNIGSIGRIHVIILTSEVPGCTQQGNLCQLCYPKFMASQPTHGYSNVPPRPPSYKGLIRP